MIDFRTLEAFVWVATLGSFRGAARRLHMTQPAISQRIAQLENDVGIKLLQRETRTVTPTLRGRELLIYAKKLLDLRTDMLVVVADASTLRGVLRVGVAETIVHTWLTRLIKQVSGTYPFLALEIEVDVTANLHARLLGQEIDLGFGVGPLSDPAVLNRPLCTYPVAFVASPTIEWVNQPVTLDELARHPIITFSRNTQPYTVVRSLFSRPDLPPVRLHASASLATVVHMAVEGLGVAVIPPVVVPSELADGRLCLVKTHVRVPSLSFFSSWPVSPDMRAAESVAQIAVDIARRHPQPP
jgi:DNA-binding transcriptional LysR family regulator